MFLKEMKKLFSIIIFFFSFQLLSQEAIIKSEEDTSFYNNIFLNNLDDILFDDQMLNFNIKPRLLFASTLGKNDSWKSIYIYGLQGCIPITPRLGFSISYDRLKGDHNHINQKYIDSLSILPTYSGIGNRLNYNIYYKINKYFKVNLGEGEHFIGNGYRSLFLSDASSSYPFLRISTELGNIKYYNLYTTFIDIQDINLDRKKHSAMHLLELSLLDYIKISAFEAVIWQAKDDMYNRGYDVEYLNPIIFYRPVEFSKHSPDNVLMGANINVVFNKFKFYSQVLLDDLNISRQKDRDENYQSGFFQNKFGYQIGVRSRIKDVNFLIEYNQVQPYTYAHKQPMQSYTHTNQAIAHPLGANFKEFIFSANYKKDQIALYFTYTSSSVGLDSVDTHYGQNIFASDFEAESDGAQYSYGNFNGQGVLTDINTIRAEIVYTLEYFDVFSSINMQKRKSDLINQTFTFYSLGIRTFPFRLFPDY